MSSADIEIINVIGANGQPLPLQGTSIGSNWSVAVKQERPDDAEIQELATKMKEAQKDALAKQQMQAAQLASRQAALANGVGGMGMSMGMSGNMSNPLPPSNGQTNILNYLNRQRPVNNNSSNNNSHNATNYNNGSGCQINSNNPNYNASCGNNYNMYNNGANYTGLNSTGGGYTGSGCSISSGPTSNGCNNRLNSSGTTAYVGTQEETKKTPCDDESQRGRFGWTVFGKIFIPFIYRQQEKYCSVRMVENKLLNKYLHCLHSDIYSSCTCVRSYYITQAEANLLHEVNSKHCDYEYTKEPFTQKDLIVRLSDATKFFQFLDICYRKLISGSKSPSEKCGFIRINKESVVPYTVRNSEQVVPLFYFEGETENLKQKADLLSGWDLAYLKFCCKVQGIRNELFSSENVAVISLTDIKSYFPNGTEFEDYWPSKVVDSNLLIGNRSNTNNTVNWTRQPSQPPPKSMQPSSMLPKSPHSSATAAAAAAAAAHQQSLLKRGQSTAAAATAMGAFNAQAALLQQPSAAAAAAAAQRLHSNAALAQATVQVCFNLIYPFYLQFLNKIYVYIKALTNGSWMPQPQNNLPLLHAQMLASQVRFLKCFNLQI